MLYGRHYSSRYRTIAELIPPNSSVLDLCCGPAVLYERHLRQKPIEYTGLDINEKFIKRIARLGAHGQIWDLRSDTPLPPADYVIMQGGLLHFLPDASPMVDRMLQAARRQVIISEAIRNFASSNAPLLASLGRWLTDPGTGRHPLRFTERTLDDFFTAYAARVDRSFLISGGREKIYVLNAKVTGDE
jgi:SAM-dependent methyltransferase